MKSNNLHLTLMVGITRSKIFILVSSVCVCVCVCLFTFKYKSISRMIFPRIDRGFSSWRSYSHFLGFSSMSWRQNKIIEIFFQMVDLV